jgi:transcriptional regulator with XRE-family HTH domain
MFDAERRGIMSSPCHNYLKVLRVEKGLSISQMANVLVIDPTAYIKLESSGNDLITIGQCKLLCAKLNINPLEIIDLLC